MHQLDEFLPFDDISRIYVTVYYKRCKHPMLRSIFRIHATEQQQQGKDRIVFSEDGCQNCDRITAARLAAKNEKW